MDPQQISKLFPIFPLATLFARFDPQAFANGQWEDPFIFTKLRDFLAEYSEGLHAQGITPELLGKADGALALLEAHQMDGRIAPDLLKVALRNFSPFAGTLARFYDLSETRVKKLLVKKEKQFAKDVPTYQRVLESGSINEIWEYYAQEIFIHAEPKIDLQRKEGTAIPFSRAQLAKNFQKDSLEKPLEKVSLTIKKNKRELLHIRKLAEGTGAMASGINVAVGNINAFMRSDIDEPGREDITPRSWPSSGPPAP